MYAGRTDGAGVLNLMLAGWILCDGSVYPNSQFPDLFTVLGNTAATPPGFAVPQYKGLFQRGLDGNDPAQRDPGVATRTAPRPGPGQRGQQRQQCGLCAARRVRIAHALVQLQRLHREHPHAGSRVPVGLDDVTTSSTGATETRPREPVHRLHHQGGGFAGRGAGWRGTALRGRPGHLGRIAGQRGLAAVHRIKQTPSSFPNLYSTVSNMFGADDQASFRLPDFRGRFLRGVVGQAIPGLPVADPDYLARTAPRPSFRIRATPPTRSGRWNPAPSPHTPTTTPGTTTTGAVQRQRSAITPRPTPPSPGPPQPTAR